VIKLCNKFQHLFVKLVEWQWSLWPCKPAQMLGVTNQFYDRCWQKLDSTKYAECSI